MQAVQWAEEVVDNENMGKKSSKSKLSLQSVSSGSQHWSEMRILSNEHKFL